MCLNSSTVLYSSFNTCILHHLSIKRHQHFAHTPEFCKFHLNYGHCTIGSKAPIWKHNCPTRLEKCTTVMAIRRTLIKSAHLHKSSICTSRILQKQSRQGKRELVRGGEWECSPGLRRTSLSHVIVAILKRNNPHADCPELPIRVRLNN